MKMSFHRIKILLISLIAIVCISGCEKKFDFSTLPKDESVAVNETTYVEISPTFSGFNQISSILIGGDQLLYVTDYGANKIYQLDIAGRKLGETSLLHPLSIAQDSRLDLLVCGETIIEQDTIGAIFRIHLAKFGLRLSDVPSESIVVVWKERSSPKRRFSGIISISENDYIAARIGPNNTSPIDPDARLLWFRKSDTQIRTISELFTGVGSGITFLNKPTGLIGFPSSKNFIVTQTSEGVNYGAIFMRFIKTTESSDWQPGYDPSIPQQRVDFVSPNQFTKATGGTIDPNRGEVFILNAGADSNSYAVFKFDNRGRFKNESIHPYAVSPPLLSPIAAGFSNRVLFIASPNRITRYKLSIDFNR